MKQQCKLNQTRSIPSLLSCYRDAKLESHLHRVSRFNKNRWESVRIGENQLRIPNRESVWAKGYLTKGQGDTWLVSNRRVNGSNANDTATLIKIWYWNFVEGAARYTLSSLLLGRRHLMRRMRASEVFVPDQSGIDGSHAGAGGRRGTRQRAD